MAPSPRTCSRSTPSTSPSPTSSRPRPHPSPRPNPGPNRNRNRNPSPSPNPSPNPNPNPNPNPDQALCGALQCTTRSLGDKLRAWPALVPLLLKSVRLSLAAVPPGGHARLNDAARAQLVEPEPYPRPDP